MAQPTAKIAATPKVAAKPATKPKAKVSWDTKYDASRTTGPDVRDPRCQGAPCYGSHVTAKPGRGSPSGSNAHGSWEACEKCLLRLSYTPAFGAHALHRKAGPLPSDTANMVSKVGPNNAGYNDKMKDRSIALDAAEVSAEKKLEMVRAQKAAWMKQQKEGSPMTNSTGATASEVPPVTPTAQYSEEMGTTPGRKARRPEATAEQLEYDGRSTQSWSEVAGTPPTSTP